ncbi:MAG: Rrf2 family transcriptional regulator [Desulforudis sp.]|nr:Rrf2 family transcriptional regulator [Clostridia bacterium]MDQ7792456.1 Rrf2 family transcriptional regulator [Clostridia bacterium]RJX19920.1 MAG: Rrf2 family transcriptional regulator [Desulforudis sp.]
MKLSTRIRYGTRALVDIARFGGDGPVSLRDIARRQDVSQPYLEQLILLLKAAGLVRSIRGARGGFLLAKNASEVTAAEIVTVLGGNITIVDCVGDPDVCSRAEDCVLRDLWADVSYAINDVLGSTTLASLVEKELDKESGREPGKESVRSLRG